MLFASRNDGAEVNQGGKRLVLEHASEQKMKGERKDRVVEELMME